MSKRCFRISVQSLGLIFITLSSLRDFDIVRVKYALQKLGCWIKESPNSDLYKEKLVFSPINFLYIFRDFIGAKIILNSVLEKSELCLGLGEKIRGWYREFKNFTKNIKFTSGIHQWWSLSKDVRSFSGGSVDPHTKLISIQWFWNWLNDKSDVLEEHCWILVDWVIECLLLNWFMFQGFFGVYILGIEGTNDPKCLGGKIHEFGGFSKDK